MKTTIVAILFLLLGLASYFFWGGNLDYGRSIVEQDADLVPLTLGTASIFVEIADTAESRFTGLSNRPYLNEDQGLLMVFERNESYPGIVMREMVFPIDIVWLNQDKVVVDYKVQATPDTYPDVFTPGSLAKYVLEVNAGFVEQYEIEIGAVAEFAISDS